MEAIRSSINGMTGVKSKKTDAVSITVNSVDSEDNLSRTSSRDTVVTAAETRPATAVSQASVQEQRETTHSHSLEITRVTHVTAAVRTLVYRLDDYDESFFRGVSLASYLEWISTERLIHMPKRGSDWDRVLKAAQFFGLQIWSFGEKICTFCEDGKTSAITALGSCQVLLEVSCSREKQVVVDEPSEHTCR
jgi:hypothetical protein